jgi:phosphatidate cytidylyltransferase
MDGANAASAASRSRVSSLALRIVSGVVLIPIILAAAWWFWSTALLVTICVIVAQIELYNILRRGGYAPRVGLGLLIGLTLCAAAALQAATGLDLSGLVIGTSIAGTLIYELAQGERRNLSDMALTYVGAFYIAALLSYFILLQQLATPLAGGWLAWLPIPPGMAWIILALAVTWLQDTVAYFVGKAYGRTVMAPLLSPKKTWEGAAAGFLASLLTAPLFTLLLGLPISLAGAALIGAAAGIIGPLGDLVESLIKRQIGIKDSGTLIPGHGGLLDRIDSMLFIGPLVYYLALALTQG